MSWNTLPFRILRTDWRSFHRASLSPQLADINTGITRAAEEPEWTTWHHAKREHNKMVDYMANVAMDATSKATLTRDTRGAERARFTDVERLCNDTVGKETQRCTSRITTWLRMYRDS